MAVTPPKFEIIDNPSIGEIYANKLVATSFDGGTITVTLGVTRVAPDHGGEPPEKQKPVSVHVTARLALSPLGAVELANALAAALKTLSQMQQNTAAKLDESPSS